MMRKASIGALVASLVLPSLALAANAPGAAELAGQQAAPYARLLVGLSLLSFIPAALVAMTSFTRIIVTLSFLRHALGMPETPPNIVLITLAMLLTFFTMAPTLEQGYRDGVVPFLEGKIETTQALENGLQPLKTFMTAHVRDEDLQSVSELAKVEPAVQEQDTPLRVLAPAFMLSELRAAFVAGFMIFLPFLLIDLLVAAILMALGMMMVPPSSISLPLKVMLFVLIDGWSLLLRALAGIYA
ncbi:MAG TPA: flagellar type III secretion system pore protein FliP [Steroidobacteraceae bacterium]|nr:flagellar type III secretion system pore protein FliP [Steroidobacteraceae bacterium]